ncbi:MAG: HEAT repeat domain-containing protein [Planctomycetales bacterium]|nr:HEAT repeat domain-containing protein [Planctomycetales bacterium]
MSIALLYQVFDETRRIAIAGSSVAPGDFRLKKLIPSLEQAGTNSPVFAKLTQAVVALLESDENSASLALLDLGTLITSILYTQGEPGIDGDFAVIESIDLGLGTAQTPAKLLGPLLEALTTKGSGRLEVIRSSYEQGLFHDLRLVRPALFALDDSYAEIAEFVAEKILPIYGPALFPELETQFNPKGKSGQSRRLLLMHKLDPARTGKYLRAALDEGNADTRVAAIECLGSSTEDLPFLLEHSKSKAKEVRRAALKSLTRMDLPEANATLIAQIVDGDLSDACEALQMSRSQAVEVVLHEQIRALFLSFLEIKVNSRTQTDANKLVERLDQLLSCLTGRTDSATVLLHTDLVSSIDRFRLVKGTPGGEIIVNRLAVNLAQGTDKMKQLLCQEHPSFGDDVFAHVFQTAVEVWKPEEFFKEFSPYLIAYHTRSSKKKDRNAYKGEVITNLLSSQLYGRVVHSDSQSMDVTRLSKKWLELAIRLGIVAIVTQLATLDKKMASPALLSLFTKLMGLNPATREFWEVDGVLHAMIQVEHPALVDSMLTVIKKLAEASPHSVHWILRHIALLPAKEAIPKLEALLPSLPDHIANQVIDSVFILKQLP